jgi:hypothetical protein
MVPITPLEEIDNQNRSNVVVQDSSMKLEPKKKGLGKKALVSLPNYGHEPKTHP